MKEHLARCVFRTDGKINCQNTPLLSELSFHWIEFVKDFWKSENFFIRSSLISLLGQIYQNLDRGVGEGPWGFWSPVQGWLDGDTDAEKSAFVGKGYCRLPEIEIKCRKWC